MSTFTQLSAWADIQDKLRGKRKEIFEVLQKTPATLFELKDLLNLEINCVSGRVSEPKHMGLVEEEGSRINPRTGKAGAVWRVKQLCLF